MALIGLALLGVTGCGAGKPELKPKVAPLTGPSGPEVAEKGRSALDGALKRARRGSAEAAVLSFWRRMRQGVVPLAALWYHSRVQRDLGLASLQGGLIEQKSFYTGFTPQDLTSESTSLGRLVTTTASNGKDAPVTVAYVVRRVGQDWRIVYDTPLEEGLVAYARRVAGFFPSKRPERVVEGASAALGERYRLLFAEQSARRGRPSPPREPSRTPAPTATATPKR